jgi:O-acetyl-ADP-ribose deacetylase (regulator of RNase III)
MITYVSGDVTNATQQVIMHGVNCAGAFGSGVAGAIKQKYPAVRDAYLAHSPKLLGTCQFVKLDDTVWVNAFTQQNYGYDGRKYADMVAVGSCLVEVAEYMKNNNMTSIAMPKIGCGLGGLEWDQVSILVEHLLKDVDVYIYEL